MKYILIMIATASGQLHGPGIATAEFDDLEACNAARTAIAQQYVVKQALPGVLVATLYCLPKSTAKN